MARTSNLGFTLASASRCALVIAALAALAACACRSKDARKKPGPSAQPSAQPSALAPRAPAADSVPDQREAPPPPPAESQPPPQPAPAPLPGSSPSSVVVPEVARWGELTASPEVTHERLAPGCDVRRTRPRFAGFADPQTARALEARVATEFDALQKALFADSPCEGATEQLPHGFEANYEFGALRGRHVALELSASAYTGGAHPNGLERCLVVSLEDGRLLKLGELLTSAGRERLSTLATQRLAEEHGVETLSEAGFFVDAVQVQNPYGVCLSRRGVRVQFQPYEVAPYALGLPAVDFPLEEVTALFDRTRARGIFGSPD